MEKLGTGKILGVGVLLKYCRAFKSQVVLFCYTISIKSWDKNEMKNYGFIAMCLCVK